jgi:hypothetical protein
MRRAALLLACLLILVGCNSPTPEPTPKRSPLEDALWKEWSGIEGEWPNVREQIRKAAVDYLKAQDAGVSIAGTSIQKYDTNCYLVWVDCGQSRIERFVVKLYVTDAGEMYWKAEPYDFYMKPGYKLPGRAVADSNPDKESP